MSGQKYIAVLTFLIVSVSAQIKVSSEIQKLSDKFLSGEIISEITTGTNTALAKTGTNSDKQLILYFNEFPSDDQIAKLEAEGVKVYPESWTPPVGNHPMGFLIATTSSEGIVKAAEQSFVKKIDLNKTMDMPMTNLTGAEIGANIVSSNGYTGKGIKIAILDSGLDTEPFNENLPANIEKKDYSSYPSSIDDNVENQITGHGTHVTGIAAGTGNSSLYNTENGGGKYKGVSSESDLVFLKIGNDFNGGATSGAIIAALDAAVNVYHANVINLSYGGWDTYHDGSSSKEQKVDWCYSQGVPVFVAAGNEGNSKRHYSGSVAGKDSSDFIRVNVTNANSIETYLAFNMVWQDGSERSQMILKIYDSNKNLLNDVIVYPTTQSSRGTESQISYRYNSVPAGNSFFYLKVVNYSSLNNVFHLYEHFGNGKVAFDNPDPNYTIISPANADYAFAVGSYNIRKEWLDALNETGYSTENSIGTVSTFSSRGPRIDGLQKPDIVAPGSAVISLRDRDIFTSQNTSWIDDDGLPGGESDFYVMQGTSMASPVCAGAAALLLSKNPDMGVDNLFDALKNGAVKDENSGTNTNLDYGYGKLNVVGAADYLVDLGIASPLPVELTSFSATELTGGKIQLQWQTASEVNNYGFEIERSGTSAKFGSGRETIGFAEGSGNSNSVKSYSFIDKPLPGKHIYRLKQIDFDGACKYSKEVEINVTSPSEFALDQNYPNPFNPVTTIKYSIPAGTENFLPVQLIVYNLLGEEVSIIVNELQPAGNYEVKFNASNLASGIYIYRLSAGNYSVVKKMTLLK